MQIRAWEHEIKSVRNGTVVMESGDHLSIMYTDPHGKSHTINVSAQHLVLMVSHEQTDAALIFRPAVGVQFSPPSK